MSTQPLANKPLHVVTGALGYSGKYITERLVDDPVRVRTLTRSPDRPNPFGDRLEIHPLDFDGHRQLVDSLRGAAVLYNTYWVRFNHKKFSHTSAVANTLALFKAAREAGVERVVHVSIAKPSEDSPFEYYRGKARLERGLVESGLPHSILRPTVLFGHEDILVNNIAWCLRRFPVFMIPGDGEYRLQPIHVDDFADLAIEQASATGNHIVDAIGPETFTYRDLVRTIGKILGCQRPVIHVPAWLALLAGKVIGRLVGDVMITREEIGGLMADLLATDSPPAGKTKLTDWARANAEQLGARYASELARRKNRSCSYAKLSYVFSRPHRFLLGRDKTFARVLESVGEKQYNGQCFRWELI